MKKTKFTVVSCGITKDNKYVWKLAVIHTGEAFGITKSFKRTYYIGGMPSAVAAGSIIEDVLEKFNIVERSCALITDATYTEPAKVMNIDEAAKLGKEYKVISLAWLHLKPTELTQKAA